MASASGAAAARPPTQLARQTGEERLRSLALGAREKRGWLALRQFAESSHNADQRGQAYFVLGYREYEAGELRSASNDLVRAAKPGFLLDDYAEYYAARAEYENKLPQLAVKILDGFVLRHSESVLRFDALALFADALLQAGEPGRAIQALEAEPRLRQRPRLELLLARAYQGAEQWARAVKSYQEVYYTFPVSHEAAEAGEDLSKLRAQMGTANLPSVSEELETSRAETLFNHSRIPEALKEYDALLARNPASSFAPRWKVGRARCWLHLKQTSKALDQLQASFPANPEADAERLETLVQAYIRQDDKTSMDLILNQLGKVYPQSPSYASALDAAGNHLIRQGDWQSAGHYYGPLAELFPDTQLGEEASWRIAWTYYLQKEKDKARQAFADHAMLYPASARVVADFYWLGRISEDSGSIGEAGAFYVLVVQRWAQSYYAVAARRRLAGLPRAGSAAWPVDSQATPLADELTQKVPPPTPPEDLCPSLQPAPALRSFSTFADLGLDDLAEHSLEAVLRERPATPALLIALSRFEAKKGNYNPSVLEAAKAAPLFYDFNFSQLPAEVWNLLYPTVYSNLVEHEAHARGLDPYLVMGLIRQESAFNPQAVSIANARGLMQILTGTARTRKSGRAATARRLYDPAYNISVGTEYLQHLLELNQGVFEQAMAAYHAGEARVTEWLGQRTFSEPAEFLETIPIPATRIYVERVVRDAAIYRKLMTAAPGFKKCS